MTDPECQAGEAPRALRGAGWASLAAFLLLAYALTWACWLPLVGAKAHPTPADERLATLGQFGPFVAAWVAAGVAGGRVALRDLLRRCLRFWVKLVYFAVALLLPPALALAAVAVQAARVGRAFEPAWPDAELVPQFVYVLLVGGPLGEELGWRGFALPRLQALCRPLAATAVLALAWAGWHLPLWWVADVPCSFPFYVFGVLPLTYLFTWLSDRTRGSVPVALAFHASVNTCVVRLPLFPAFEVWTGLLWVAAAFAYVLDRAHRSGSKLATV